MMSFFENLVARLWNGKPARKREEPQTSSLKLGLRVSEDDAGRWFTVPNGKRAEHCAFLGKTGSGKSSAMAFTAQQDIAALRPFLNYDVHGSQTEFLLSAIADLEKATGRDLSDRVIVIDPADEEYSVGMNPLEKHGTATRYVQIAEFAAVLHERWHLDSFGARTDELLRNSLYVLAEAGLTLLEITPLLTNAAFRAACLKKVDNAEVRQYFELRFDAQSEAMQATMREPILNKTSAFTADPHFRHIVGQSRSTFSLLDAMDEGKWIIVNLDKGRLGEQSGTLGSLFFTTVTNTLFVRRERTLFSVYIDEIQNFVANGSRIDTVLSEARKFGVGVLSANQFLAQYPAEVRAAILSVGTHCFFQLSSVDANEIANALDGGKPLAERLKNLPRRHMVVKSGSASCEEVVVPTLTMPKSDPRDLYRRSRARWARPRREIEAEIAARQAVAQKSSKEALHDWE